MKFLFSVRYEKDVGVLYHCVLSWKEIRALFLEFPPYVL